MHGIVKNIQLHKQFLQGSIISWGDHDQANEKSKQIEQGFFSCQSKLHHE